MYERAFVSFAGIIEPALVLRAKGPSHYADEPISVATGALREFFCDHHYLIIDEVLSWDGDEPYSDVISNLGKATLAAKLSSSGVLVPEERLLLFPLTPVSVLAAFQGKRFALVDPGNVLNVLPDGYRRSTFAVDRMPSFGKREGDPVESWLSTRGPSDNAAKKAKRIVLGALSLGPIHRERYMFVMRPATKNYLRLGDGLFTCSSNPHTPPVSDGIVVRGEDHPWLSKLDGVLEAKEKADRGRRNALDYFYRAWFLEPVERCAMMFMALDALYEHTAIDGATKRMELGIVGSLQTSAVKPQLKVMMKLRNSVVHGGSPDVFATSLYQAYWRKFGSDLATDLEVVTAKCLRREIFGDDFVPQADPHAELVAEHQALGHIPSQEGRHIVPEWP